MPGMSRRVPGIRKRATRWRPRGRLTLTLAVIAPVVVIAAVTAPRTASLAAMVTPAAGTSVAAPAAVPGPPSGWSTVFSDDFNGTSGTGADSQWMYDTGPGSNFGTGEIETMTNSTSNVHLDGNGNLDLTALGSGSNWTSGRLQTTTANVGAPAGGELEVTASIQQPTGGLGYWPAFWMLGPGQWPENGEIDIMEDVNALSEVAGTIHCGVDPGGPCNETNGIGSGLRACSGCQSGFHTYTMILNRTNTSAESITFYLDGTQYFSVSEAQVGTSTWQAAYDHNLSILLDLAMGGGFPNGVCNCTTPTSSTASGGTMSVAYVAAYSTGSGTTTPPPPPPPSGGSAITGYQGLCVDVRAANSANFTPVQVYTCNGTNAQQWTVVQAGSTLHALGKCMDINGGGTADGTTVDLYDCNNTGSQVFIPQSNGELYNPQSNKCLDDTSFGGAGTQLQIWDCTDGANQQWHLP
jgi:Ricin-type beta-trefoil lectin domain/Glycosyl hydrolases family 16